MIFRAFNTYKYGVCVYGVRTVVMVMVYGSAFIYVMNEPYTIESNFNRNRFAGRANSRFHAALKTNRNFIVGRKHFSLVRATKICVLIQLFFVFFFSSLSLCRTHNQFACYGFVVGAAAAAVFLRFRSRVYLLFRFK